MSTATGEVVGLDQSIAYAQHLAEQAGGHGPDGNEGYLTRLAACRVTGAGLATGRDMQDAFAAAAAAATTHASELQKQKSIQEQYDVNPDAGDKTYLGGNTDAAAVTPGDHGLHAAQPAERSERLARGIYIGAQPQAWRRDQAREWDAGRADPDDAAEAYARADEILAARAKLAEGPGGDRLESMRTNEVTRCPAWCPQPDNEQDHEEHIGPARTMTTEAGDEVSVRPRVSWWSDVEPSVELTVKPREDSTSGLVLTSSELATLQQLTDQVLDGAEHDHDQSGAGKPAYPGAEYDDVDLEHRVLEPGAAAAALDAAARTGFLQLGEDDDAPYMDWSTVEPGGTLRHLEAGDGEQTATIALAPDDLRELRDGMGRLLGLVDDGQDDPGAMWLTDDSDGPYIDWSTQSDGRRRVEIGDGDQAAQLVMDPEQLRDFYDRLDLQIHLDDHDGLDLRASTHQAGGTR